MGQEEDLDKLRERIDALDGELLEALARRMKVVAEIGRYKKARGMELRDEERLRALLAKQLDRAGSLNLPKELVTELYELIHKYALRIENEA
jgi:chorismate mutase